MTNKNFSSKDFNPATIAIMIILAMTGLNGLFNSLASALGFGFPYDTFLFNPSDIFADLIKVAASFPGDLPKDLNARANWEIAYFSNNPYGGIDSLSNANLSHFHLPPLATLFYLASRSFLNYFSGSSLLLLTTLMWLIPLLASSFLLTSNVKRVFLILVATAFSYPVLFAITRGNVAAGFTATAIVLATILAFKKENKIILAILLAIAINFRPNTVIFLLLPFVFFPFRSAIKIVLLAFLTSGLLFAASLNIIPVIYPDYSLSNWIKGVSIYHDLYVLGNSGLAYGSSMFGAAKAFFSAIGIIENVNLELMNYMITGSFLFVLLASIYIYWKNIISDLTFLFIIFAIYTLASSVFADYHLIIYIAIIIFAVSRAPNIFAWEDYISLISSALLLSPKNFMFISGYSLQIILNPIILIVALFLIFLKSRNFRQSITEM